MSVALISTLHCIFYLFIFACVGDKHETKENARKIYTKRKRKRETDNIMRIKKNRVMIPKKRKKETQRETENRENEKKSGKRK